MNQKMPENFTFEECESYIENLFHEKHVNKQLTWDVFTELANNVAGTTFLPAPLSQTTWRRKYYTWLSESNTSPEEAPQPEESDATKELRDLILEFKKVKVQISDERTQNNAYIRQLSREDTLKEIAHDAARAITNKKLLVPSFKPLPVTDPETPTEGILCISDWHYGMDFENHMNVYNPRVCVERLIALRDEVIRKGKLHKIQKLHVVDLGDLIAGRIHLTIRLESRIDVITQIMQVSELLAEFLTELSEHFIIEYRSTLDNHSRLEPNKKESLNIESLARITPWFLQKRLIDNDRVKILYNTFADDIITFNVFNWNVAGVHGDKDKPGRVVRNMIAITKALPDLVLSAHDHHFAGEEEDQCVRLSNGTLMGVDNHSLDLRLTSKPSQNLIIATPYNVTDSICKINL